MKGEHEDKMCLSECSSFALPSCLLLSFVISNYNLNLLLPEKLSTCGMTRLFLAIIN